MNSSRVALIISVSLILSLGLVMVFNTTSAEVIDRSLNISTHQAMIKQVIYSILGIFCGMAIYVTGYKNIVRLSPFLFFLSLILLSLVFLPGIGHVVNGSRRWIGIEGYTFQPSELAKYLIPIYFIRRYTEKEKIESFSDFLKFISIFFFPLLLIFLEPDNGTSAIIILTLLILFFIFRVKISYWALPLLIVAVVGG
jgi:cell division protein FtsW